ncbi:MAG: hypothetical protein J7465_05260, partial [Chloroflexus sp.]|nr:hypothetical protein [Chloroflexus sp.]
PLARIRRCISATNHYVSWVRGPLARIRRCISATNHYVSWVRGLLARIRRCIAENDGLLYQHSIRVGWHLFNANDNQCAASFPWRQCELPAMSESGSKQPSKRQYLDTLFNEAFVRLVQWWG